ncbi:hypothetical protein HDU97_001316 [Phlyctochytrium planicorne]|nr:hypothetical protein HDU97_001316 [Phlyctochytrium planicorne]
MEITTLTNEEEEKILKTLKKTAMTKCQPAVRAFVDCSTHKTVSLFFSCHDLNKKMNECLSQYTTDTERDTLREQMLAEKIEFRKKNWKKGDQRKE